MKTECLYTPFNPEPEIIRTQEKNWCKNINTELMVIAVTTLNGMD